MFVSFWANLDVLQIWRDFESWTLMLTNSKDDEAWSGPAKVSSRKLVDICEQFLELTEINEILLFNLRFFFTHVYT